MPNGIVQELSTRRTIMIIKVSKENYTIPNEYIKIAEFYDAFHVSEFIKDLVDKAEETGKDKYLIDISFYE